MKRIIILLLACVIMPSSRAASFQLNTVGQEPIYQTVLNQQVYANSHRNDLQDLTIHNAAGEQLPYALLPYVDLHPQDLSQTTEKTLAIFPIQENKLQDTKQLRIELQTSPNNTHISLDANSNAQNTVYLMDAGEHHPALQNLRAEWQGGDNTLIYIDIFSSDDLKNWVNVGNAVLLNSTNNGQQIVQNSMQLNAPISARYLQIKPIAVSDFKLNKVTAEYHHTQATALPFLWQNIQQLQREEISNTGQTNLNFEALGRYPASQLRIQLPQQNTITQVNIYVRNSVNEAWVYLTNASLYRMRKDAHEIHHADIAIRTTTARYWQLQFNQATGGIGAQNPTLSLGWLPQSVLWNARGQAPFTLHVGENTRIVNPMPITSLIPKANLAQLTQLPIANLAPSTERPTENSWGNAPNYQRWLLWAGLALGVLLLASMVTALLKAQNKQTPK